MVCVFKVLRAYSFVTDVLGVDCEPCVAIDGPRRMCIICYVKSCIGATHRWKRNPIMQFVHNVNM